MIVDEAPDADPQRLARLAQKLAPDLRNDQRLRAAHLDERHRAVGDRALPEARRADRAACGA